ncbi:hypothetical protein HYV85_00910 [Candidatus Woesearchaeota archaeon]|nr:hypothetical protein [Candidatus Woesearchaeota archaeon]
MTWRGNRIRHSLARRGIRLRRKPTSSIYDVRGLEKFVDGVVNEVGVPRNEQGITEVSVRFYDWEIVADASKFGEKPSVREMAAAKAFIMGFDEADRAYIFVGKGGTFVHPSGYGDNHYMQPVGYHGPAILLARPVELCAVTKERGKGQPVEIPFAIAGFVGLEGLVNKAHMNGHRRTDLGKTVKLGV